MSPSVSVFELQKTHRKLKAKRLRSGFEARASAVDVAPVVPWTFAATATLVATIRLCVF
jgi:hypothetical protein